VSRAPEMQFRFRCCYRTPHYPEVAMLFRRDAHQVRYMMYPVSHGTGIMVRSPVGRWTMPDVETALAKVLVLEQRTADA
jgi:hypothetical protein